MKFPSFKRIVKTDFEAEDQNLVEKLSLPINSGFSNLYKALEGNLNLRDNVACVIKDVDVIVDATGIPTTKTGMSLDDTTQRVDGITVIRVDNLNTATIYPDTAPFISFQQSEKTILFNHITGLQAGYNWRIRVIAWLA